MKAGVLYVLQQVRAAEAGGAPALDAKVHADSIYTCMRERWLVLGGTLQAATLTLTIAGREALARAEGGR